MGRFIVSNWPTTFMTNAVLISAQYHSFVHKNFEENQKIKKINHEVYCREVGRCPFDIVLKTKGPWVRTEEQVHSCFTF